MYCYTYILLFIIYSNMLRYSFSFCKLLLTINTFKKFRMINYITDLSNLMSLASMSLFLYIRKKQLVSKYIV